MSDALNPLLEISKHVEAEAKVSRVAVIFDLDSTLFCVSSRTQHILRRLGHEPDFMERFSNEAEILRNIEVLPSDYGIRAALQRTAVQATPELIQHVRHYWGTHFFSSQFLDQDILYPSAREYVSHLHALGAHIRYLTGRSADRMREGTVRVLKSHGFPFDDDSILLMKTSEVEADEHFKVQILRDLAPGFDHIWFFENEPVIIEQVRAQVPQVRLVFVHSVHSGKAAVPVGLRTIKPDYSSGIGIK